jgi:NADH-quinone oxidoreductase subunit M
MIALSIFLIPLLTSFLLFNSKTGNAAKTALTSLTLMLLVSIGGRVATAYGLTGTLSFPLISSIGFSFSLLWDGPAFLMVLLTIIAGLGIVYFSQDKEIHSSNRFYGWIMMMLSAMIGAFLAGDALLFYLCYEWALIPIFFLILKWGHGEHLSKVTMRFFLYTLFGSLFMMLSLLYVHQSMAAPSFDMNAIWAAGKALTAGEQGWVFAGLFIAFAVKMPVFPFHSWQPSTYDHAPIQGTMLLAAIMLKMATFGLVRWAIPMTAVGIAENGHWAILLSVISVVYASFMALTQKRLKMMIAYSSVAHVGMISAGILSNTDQGTVGGLFEMFSHGILAVAMFVVYAIIEKRYGHDRMQDMGGIRTAAPAFAFLTFILVMCNVALPFTSGFVGEFLLLQSLAHYSLVYTAIAGLSVILGAAYMLRGFQAMFLGGNSHAFEALSKNEKNILAIAVLLVIVLGVYPHSLLQLIQNVY